ncbi:4-hydroxythreonine-4-phosphate dehydrogenase PdxA [Agrobacterium rosae]|uniref:4-hydroxythreonine-4-phosphate dehydrogenase n=1 Tax=Agrobacterium rosae TaxID=1972867 RepID=A0AAE5VPY4_9HYPH|nr:4-hydroxythreonine-4-phosphate dehydrogenase PdxA [Agrobacterium rosae]KAA3514669.1 4-hydroxythreonine-4-phosphate dehydrogenase PdxA [Agrobacterium rosae]KAA3523338.1 4-hydroxythreonine-4-phosphate dehydrogenase PdxA [Agrobacterium rosae]MCM2433465.1 4-hydroxythreonine-4-phosphate dehydrogenase PdxA [Agrobacterium rosae]MDX8329983.1 4-hydroxythreonine-4-phosphate dehydrogenase PdxA [Agrobacterium rosae]MQB47943.1 4-hydroxythreonine-4-phosphate dehydrogenase PdxA [Agrobacterium rosae]
MTLQQLPLALTQGDPAGIGPDITVVAWAKRKELGLPPFIFIGDPDVIASRANLLGIHTDVVVCEPEQAASIFPDALPVFPIAVGFDVQVGQPHVGTALSTIKAIETAVSLTVEKRTSAVVTNPIAKSVLYEAGFGFPGHTEFLAELANKLTGQVVTPVMMIAGPKLRVVPVTIHIPVKDVPAALTEELIIETCRIIAADLRDKFGIEAPRLAVAGLNPHAGEDGAIGTEDRDIIHPATIQLRKDGIDAFGPLPADTMFHEAARRRYDVAVCMYHDQALIPAKALGFDDSVNVTLGLPFIRTSPDHGTAFGIAGQGIANESSLVAALKMAAEIAARRVTA